MTTQATTLFKDHFLTPATDVWNDLRNGTLNSFTQVDVTNFLWNSFLCSIPFIAGGATAYVINTSLHKHLPEKSFTSIFYTTISTLIAVAISFLVIKILIASNGKLAPFTADKALKLETFHVVVMAVLLPLKYYLQIPYLLEFNTIVGAPAAAGFFGTRSLYVIGFLSALQWAVNAAANAAVKSSLPPDRKEEAEIPLVILS